MTIGTWLGVAGISALLGACSGTTVTLGDGTGGVGSAGGAGSAGSAGKVSAGETVASQGGGDDSVGHSVAIGGSGGSDQVMAVTGVAGGAQLALAPVDAQQQSDKLDVLFVVDNSGSMRGKQSILAKSLPAFIQRLVNPPCVDAQGAPVSKQPASGAAACLTGTRQFAPVKDMHLGAITTSLGSHGGTVCATGAGHLDDKAELLGITRDGVPSYKNSGYLSWDSAGKNGLADAGALSTQLATMIDAAGDDGCGFEATLESMYRFLIDPAPPDSVVLTKNSNTSTPTGVNTALLVQRAAFLRPNSSVAIVILSDENDCSIVDTGIGWFVGGNSRMPRATEVCASDPNDACCRSCAQIEDTPPTGCPALKDDAVCKNDTGITVETWDALHDPPSLRCFAQKSRFGFDLLNPLDRYSLGLTNPQVVDWNGQLVQNPLFAARDGKGPRSNSLISVSVIAGAAWQDLATDDSRSTETLTYLDAANLESKGRWPMLVGDGEHNVPPTDPLNRESIDPRSGKSPLTNAPLVGADSTDPLANASNGHEHSVPDRGDLQYACTFPLAAPVTCPDGDTNCECSPDGTGNTDALTAANSPLCQAPAGGPSGSTQYFAKGYPGTRQLLLARTLGSRAAPASICPKDAKVESSQSFGYVPALNALVNRLAVTLK